MKAIGISAILLVMIFRTLSRSFRLLTVLILVGSRLIWCQTNDVQGQLNSAYKNKILLLRNFYAGSDLAYDQNGALRGTASQGPWTLADVEIKGIGITAQEIEIVGNRMGVSYTDGKPGMIKIGKLKIHVARPALNADTKAELDPILSKVFIDPTEDLRPLLPDVWSYYLAGKDLQSRFAGWQAALGKGAGAPLRQKDFPPDKPGAPRAIYSPDPKYTREAASEHIEGLSVLSTVVDVTGSPGDIAILRPLGMGLDEEAVSALKQWRFRPATLNGQTVPVQVIIEITFRCCR